VRKNSGPRLSQPAAPLERVFRAFLHHETDGWALGPVDLPFELSKRIKRDKLWCRGPNVPAGGALSLFFWLNFCARSSGPAPHPERSAGDGKPMVGARRTRPLGCAALSSAICQFAIGPAMRAKSMPTVTGKDECLHLALTLATGELLYCDPLLAYAQSGVPFCLFN